MFKNKTLQVQVVKKDPNVTEEPHDETSFEKKARIFAHHLERSIKIVAFTVVGYVLIDTYRQVQIEHAKK